VLLQAPDPPSPYCVTTAYIASPSPSPCTRENLGLPSAALSSLDTLNRREPLCCHALSKSRYSADPDLDYIHRYALARRRARPDPFATAMGPYRVN
jgi:hypothetical protein